MKSDLVSLHFLLSFRVFIFGKQGRGAHKLHDGARNHRTVTVLHSSDEFIGASPFTNDDQPSVQHIIRQRRTHQANTFHPWLKNVPHLLTTTNERSHLLCRSREKGSPRPMWSSYSCVSVSACVGLSVFLLCVCVCVRE